MKDALARRIARSAVAGWTAYTPTVTALGGTFGEVAGTGRYRKVGTTVHFRVRITITTAGTAAGAVQCTLPFATANIGANFAQIAVGREVGATGLGLNAELPNNSSTMLISRYDGAFIGSDGYVLVLSGTYESA